METSVRFIFIFLFMTIALSTTDAFGNNFRKLKQMRRQERERRFAKLKLADLENAILVEDSVYRAKTKTQPLDHFDPQVEISYKQRYWVNRRYWKKPNGPVFLFIGGEEPLSGLEVIEGELVELAMKEGALLFAVEHRFYGRSMNRRGLEMDEMKQLSSQQALADLASFHSFATTKFKLTPNNTWICYGGSYPGALAAWFRLKYPHLVYAAVANSAPVEAEVNFQGYNEVVAAAFADPVVHGSEECAANIRKAFSKVDAMLDAEQLAQLGTDFMTCGPIRSADDVYMLSSNLADVFMSTVQYNDEEAFLSIKTICTNMTASGSDPYDSLKRLNRIFLENTDQICSDTSWDNFIEDISNVRVSEDGMRQWMYQTCSQFGYYVTCDKGTTCLFSKYLHLQPYLDMCQYVYDVRGSEVYRRVDFSNAYYGGDQPKGTRILFVNGSIDPWNALSVLRNLSMTEKAIIIQGAAHCRNMLPSQPTDPEPLRVARQKIAAQVHQWVMEAQKVK